MLLNTVRIMFKFLLIVPEGIEILLDDDKKIEYLLLIVPEGIEIVALFFIKLHLTSF